MSRSHEILYFVGQRLLWGLQGGVFVFCLVHLRGTPALVTMRAPDVHVHLAPTPAAVAPPPAPVALPSAPLEPRFDRPRTACAGVRLLDGIHVDSFRSITYVDRAWVDHLLENQPILMRSARIVPETRDGRTIGIRLFGIRPGASGLARLGFENGDLLRAINGYDIADPERALEAYAKLRSSFEFYALIERHNIPRFMEFRIC